MLNNFKENLDDKITSIVFPISMLMAAIYMSLWYISIDTHTRYVYLFLTALFIICFIINLINFVKMIKDGSAHGGK